ncbi:hypothetical protein [Halanaerobium sp.]|uniref:hypothetical protein n=1 Tax=Halanaerobium sp. TaxID=1895664 RepID=UPI000DE6B769|nr:hypothetical protein [Halanaerobium sp.]PUU91315.1 MAG: Diguanylate cyclase/phosphodiesterase (GGDEF & EAL domains) with PAS/PAC sensor(S) [Halanaerobium sp.]
MMTTQSLNNFLKDEIKKIKISDYINNKILISFNIFYIFSAVFLILSNSANLSSLKFSSATIRGIIVQLQIILLLSLTIKYALKGFVSALILNVFSIFSVLTLMIVGSSISFLPALIAYLTVLIILYLIFVYQQEISLKINQLKKEKKKLHYMAYYDNLTEIANRVTSSILCK